jgi:hypothetical protein
MKNFVPLLELKQQPLSKQINAIAQLYISRCIDDEEVRKKRFTTTLFPIKKFLEKQPLSSIYVLYDYLYSLKDKAVMDLSTAFREAKAYQQKLRWENDKTLQPEVSPYDSYEDCLRS